MLYENEILEYCRKQDEHLASAEHLELVEYMKMYYFVITKREVHEDFPDFFTWSSETVQERLSEWRMKCMEELTSVYPDSVLDFRMNVVWLFPFQSGVRVRDDLDGGRHPWEISNPVAI